MDVAKTLVVDTAHLAEWSRNFGDGKLNGTDLVNRLSMNGWVLAITWHNFEELLKHRDDQVVENRIGFIRSLPFMSWLAAFDGSNHIGSILDLLAFEASASRAIPAATAHDVIDVVRPIAFRFGLGDQCLQPYEGCWGVLREAMWEREKRQREISSISQLETTDKSKEPLLPWLRGNIRSTKDANRQLEILRSNMIDEISARGDPRLEDINETVDTFVGELTSDFATHARSADPIGSYLDTLGVNRSELQECATVADLTDLATFRSKLGTAGTMAGINVTDQRKIRSDSIPSWVIQRAFDRHKSSASRAKGGDLNDLYILSVAPYCSRVYVDKRTLDNYRRTNHHDESIQQFQTDVRRAATVFEILDDTSNGVTAVE